MSTAKEEAERRYPSRYWPNHEPDGDYPGKLMYLDGVTTDDLREAFEQGADWHREQPHTHGQSEAAAKAMVAELHEYNHDFPAWDDLDTETRDHARIFATIALEAARGAADDG
jgi:hypothetical protein